MTRFKPTLSRALSLLRPSGRYFCFLSVLLATLAARAEEEKSQERWIVELSPFKALWGQPSLRLERKLGATPFAGALMGEKITKAGERKDFEDSYERLVLEGLWYPRLATPLLPFAGLSLGLEQGRRGRRLTYQRQNLAWEESHHGLSSQQFIGLRLFHQQLWTGSLRLLAEQPLYLDRQVSGAPAEEIRKLADSGLPRPPRLRYLLMLYIGFALP